MVSKYIDKIERKCMTIVYSLLKQKFFIFGIKRYNDGNIKCNLKYKFFKYLYINKILVVSLIN